MVLGVYTYSNCKCVVVNPVSIYVSKLQIAVDLLNKTDHFQLPVARSKSIIRLFVITQLQNIDLYKKGKQ